VQPPETIFWLRMITAPLPATVNLIAYVIFRRFPYDPADAARIQAALDARRAVANGRPDGSSGRVG